MAFEYKAPAPMMDVKPLDTTATDAAMVEGVKGIGEGIKQAGQLATNIYSQKAFREYQADVMSKLKTQYGPTFKELIPAAMMKPDQVVNGLKNVAKLMNVYDAVKKSNPTAQLAEPGQLASVAFYGSDADSEQMYKAMMGHLDEEGKRQADLKLGEYSKGVWDATKTEDENKIAVADATMPASVKEKLISQNVGRDLYKEEQLRINWQKAQNALEAAKLRAKAAATKNAQTYFVQKAMLGLNSLKIATGIQKDKDKAEKLAYDYELKAIAAENDPKLKEDEKKAVASKLRAVAEYFKADAAALDPSVENSRNYSNILQNIVGEEFNFADYEPKKDITPPPPPLKKSETQEPKTDAEKIAAGWIKTKSGNWARAK